MLYDNENLNFKKFCYVKKQYYLKFTSLLFKDVTHFSLLNHNDRQMVQTPIILSTFLKYMKLKTFPRDNLLSLPPLKIIKSVLYKLLFSFITIENFTSR